MSFLCPNNGIHLFEKLVEWHPPFTESGDESAQGSQTVSEPLYTLDAVYRAHVGDGHDLFGVGLDATLGHNVSKQLPFETLKTHFSGFNLRLNLWRFANIAAKFVIRSLV